MDFRQVLGTSNRRRLRLIELLYYQREGLSSEQLLEGLDCSLPILLKDIAMINELDGDFLVEKAEGLYRVVLKKDVSIGKLYSLALINSPEFQIIEELLYENCENIEALSKRLFISYSNAQRYLKKAEQALNQAGIKLCYRPLRLEGRESVIRHFYYRYFLEKQYTLKIDLPNIREYQLVAIEKFVAAFTEINGFHKKYIFQKRVTYNVFISLWRIKNGHYYPKEELRTTGLALPETKDIQKFRDTVSEVFRLELTLDEIRDCLWLSFSDAIVFSKKHLEIALSDNPRYQRLFKVHLKLAEQYMKLLGVPLDAQRMYDLTMVLMTDVYLYDEDKKFLTILRKSRAVFLETVKTLHEPAVVKVTEIVRAFVEEYGIYQNEDFIINYVYLLLTQEVNSLELLASQDKTIHLLLISDLSPTEEEFMAKGIRQIVYGNYEIHHFEGIWDNSQDMYKKILTYDGLITTGGRGDLPSDYPLVIMDPYVTLDAVRSIQKLVNQLSEKIN
ncbi:helix-turn-helix domain-containing protein [Enterococcus pseudoavium]|uniref:Helix-turn-helix domain-containing protein n=1 Tax=Enterococcus pseudoavium TaxID=44007 RepID=A0ABU3FE66_9ENTE|nr:helix-turn-helix domain-containing protein [Enterococcus pseudoavium]MDT2754613.1 helix-turn-helix domain-containing protein [Enterococcus pseudoavium]MDT2769332.1 helix-turn-helix domain-containing protein [Enterococcus pseudoavium]